jgi:succinate dehydrogenase / fumarate reductase flavoprotein subunit
MQWEVTLRQLENTQEEFFAKPVLHIHPTCPVSGDHQSKLTLMSESLRNDGRIWVPAKLEDAQAIRDGKKTNRII